MEWNKMKLKAHATDTVIATAAATPQLSRMTNFQKLKMG
jgi:hypothetical protein